MIVKSQITFGSLPVTETVIPSHWEAYIKHKELNIQSLLAVKDVRYVIQSHGAELRLNNDLVFKILV